jgi:predicted DNA binding CopG/RHH family protein
MKQVKVAFTDRQLKALKKEAMTFGISFAELIRRILDRHLDEKKK